MLYLSENSLTGLIPSSLGNLKNLRALLLHSNKLQGNMQLYFHISHSNLIISFLHTTESNHLFLVSCFDPIVGSVPPQLGNLTQLTNLFLCDNSLSGLIPSKLA